MRTMAALGNNVTKGVNEEFSDKDLFALPKPPAMACVSTEASAWKGDVVFIALTEEAYDAEAKALVGADAKKTLEGFGPGILATVMESLDDEEFKLKPGASKFFSTCGASTAKNVCIVGLGSKDDLEKKEKKWGKSPWQALGATMKSVSKANKCATAALAVPGLSSTVIEDVCNGLLTGAYESTRFKSKPGSAASLTSVDVLGSIEGMDARVADAVSLAEGITIARYLVEAPPNVASPKHLNDCAKHIALTHSNVFELRTYGRKECEDMGMGCYLAVGEAADTEPQFIHLTYRGPGCTDASPKIGYVGKGVTFDSGGYNIKAGAGSMIEMMKFDMGGAGAVLGSAMAVGGMRPSNVEVHFITAACENMISGSGLRPGDVITASNGKTVEVNNTDAEGRLTLCDAIVYAGKQGCTTIVDIATLTGACIVALGMGIGGLYANTDGLASDLSSSGAVHGEKLWRLPLEDDYMEHLKSPVADMKNTGIRWGGSITAALYLKEFVPENTEWAHIDMAGPVWDEKNGGATGFGVATLAQYAKSKSS